MQVLPMRRIAPVVRGVGTLNLVSSLGCCSRVETGPFSQTWLVEMEAEWCLVFCRQQEMHLRPSTEVLGWGVPITGQVALQPGRNILNVVKLT